MVLYEYLADIKSATYTIHVEPTRIDKLNVYNPKSYTTVSVIDPSDFTFTGNYNNGKVYDVDSSLVEFIIPDTSEPGDYPVEFSYTEFYSSDPNDYRTVKSTFTIHIDPEPVIVEIQPTAWLETTFYTDEGVNFDRSDWVAIRNNGEITNIYIEDNYCLNPEVLYTKEPGEYTLYIQPVDTCEVYEYNFEIVENVLEEIEVYANDTTFYMEDNIPYELQPDDITCYAYYTKPGDIREIDFSDLDISQTTYEEPGSYLTEVTYSETFEYAGDISLTTVVEININTNDVVSIDAYNDHSYLRYSIAPTRETFNGTQFIVTRENGNQFYVDYDNPNLSFDFDGVDRYTPGEYEVPVYYYHNGGDSYVSTSVYVNIIGIKEFVGHFENVPEKILCDYDYSDEISNWNIYAEVTYSDETSYEYTNYVYPGYEGFEIIFTTPITEPGECELVITYDDSYEFVSDSTFIQAIPYGVDHVDFDVSSVDGATIKDSEELDSSYVNATIYYKDGTVETTYFTSGLIKEDFTSLGGSPEQVQVTYSLEIDDKIFSDDSTIINVIRPVNIESELIYSDYVFHAGEQPETSMFDTYLVYDDGSSEPISCSDITAEWADTPVAGYNDVVISYNYEDFTFDTVVEVQAYTLDFEVNIVDKDYYEGDVLTSEDYSTYIIYQYGGLRDDLYTDASPYVTVSTENPTLVGGENLINFHYLSDYPAAEFNVDKTIDAYCIDHIDIDSSLFETDYFRLDDEPDFSVIKVTAVYVNGEGEEIEKDIDIADCEIKGFDTDTNGEGKSFSITCEIGSSKLVNYVDYNVYEPIATDVVLIDDDCSLIAYEGLVEGVIDLSEMKYQVTYENGKTETFFYDEYNSYSYATSYAPTVSNKTKAQVLQFVFNYEHYSHEGTENFGPLTSDITIFENKVERLELDLKNVQTVFYEGQEFNYDYLNVYSISTAYEDFPELGKVELTKDDFTVQVDELSLGKNTVTIIYNADPNVKATYEVELKEDGIRSIYLYGCPTTVKQGEEIDLSLLHVHVNYLSGKDEYVYAPEFEITKMPSSEKIGKTTIEVSYGGKTKSAEITVVENTTTLEYISLSTNTISIVEGDEMSFINQIDAIVVTGHFLDEDDRVLEKDEYSIAGNYDCNKVGTYELTVEATVNGITKTSELILKVSESLKPTGVQILESYTFTLNEEYDPESFLNSTYVEIYYNIKDSRVTTMADDEDDGVLKEITYYTLVDQISTDKLTEEGEPGEAVVLVVVEVNGEEYEFEVELRYYIVEA